MPITFDYLIADLLLSNPLLISSFLIGGTANVFILKLS